jgi:hypothetical protein
MNLIVEIVVLGRSGGGALALRGCAALQKLRMAFAWLAGGPFCGVAADPRLQLDNVEEYVGLPT